MSTSVHDSTRAEGRGSAVASALLVALLAVSITWPDPVLRLNRLFFNAPLDVSEVSFLGREAPRWDVVYWWIVGMTLLVFLYGRLGKLRESWPLFVAGLPQ